MSLSTSSLVTLSIVLAIVIAVVAWLAFYVRRPSNSAESGSPAPFDPSRPQTTTPSSMNQPQAADPLAVLERLVGDDALRADVIRLFLEECPRRLAEIKAAIDQRDAGSLRTAARMLKGAATNLSAGRLFHLAETLERIGAEARLDAAPAAWILLDIEAAQTMEALRRIKLPQDGKSSTNRGDGRHP
jgi:HPt (histidine-containing phosphotransfer) domain-containing protein